MAHHVIANVLDISKVNAKSQTPKSGQQHGGQVPHKSWRMPQRIEVSLTAVMEPPMFGVMEPQTVAKTIPRRGLNNGGFCLFFGDGFA
jgi:hypothetical protein